MNKSDVLSEINKADDHTEFYFDDLDNAKFFSVFKMSDNDLILNAMVSNYATDIVASAKDFISLINSMSDTFTLSRNNDTEGAGILPPYQSVKYDSETNTIQFKY